MRHGAPACLDSGFRRNDGWERGGMTEVSAASSPFRPPLPAGEGGG